MIKITARQCPYSGSTEDIAILKGLDGLSWRQKKPSRQFLRFPNAHPNGDNVQLVVREQYNFKRSPEKNEISCSRGATL